LGSVEGRAGVEEGVELFDQVASLSGRDLRVLASKMEVEADGGDACAVGVAILGNDQSDPGIDGDGEPVKLTRGWEDEMKREGQRSNAVKSEEAAERGRRLTG
jgi:hypothetical protein